MQVRTPLDQTYADAIMLRARRGSVKGDAGVMGLMCHSAPGRTRTEDAMQPRGDRNPDSGTVPVREAWRAERSRAAPGRRRRVRAAAGAKRPWSRSRAGGMQSASDTPSSHSSQGRAQPDRAPRAHVVAQRGPERGEPGPKQVVAKERVRPAAGAPGRIHERHATLRRTQKTGRLAASGQCRDDSGHEARSASLFEQLALVN
jgi:hypothetical protein